jgi:hypothetical protein
MRELISLTKKGKRLFFSQFIEERARSRLGSAFFFSTLYSRGIVFAICEAAINFSPRSLLRLCLTLMKFKEKEVSTCSVLLAGGSYSVVKFSKFYKHLPLFIKALH